mmetsp:Transcript_15157/g.17007  ORF Transcript_15157/g.17007 Transcript_15157/m.17007 type:complete len:127 (-) Transcript_15157:283-663(-)
MTKSNKLLPLEGMAQSLLGEYYEVVRKQPEEKDQEKALETEEEIVFSDVSNDNNDKNKNDDITTHTTQPEEATNTETNTVSAKDMQQDKDKDKDKDDNKEEVESSNEEIEEESLDWMDFKNKNNDV